MLFELLSSCKIFQDHCRCTGARILLKGIPYYYGKPISIISGCEMKILIKFESLKKKKLVLYDLGNNRMVNKILKQLELILNDTRREVKDLNELLSTLTEFI